MVYVRENGLAQYAAKDDYVEITLVGLEWSELVWRETTVKK